MYCLLAKDRIRITNILIHRPFAAAAPVQKNPKEWGGGDFKVIFQSKGIPNWFYGIFLRKCLPTLGVWGTNPNESTALAPPLPLRYLFAVSAQIFSNSLWRFSCRNGSSTKMSPQPGGTWENVDVVKFSTNSHPGETLSTVLCPEIQFSLKWTIFTGQLTKGYLSLAQQAKHSWRLIRTNKISPGHRAMSSDKKTAFTKHLCQKLPLHKWTMNSIIVMTVYRYAGLQNWIMEHLFWELISYWQSWYETRIKDQRVHTGNGCRRLIMEFGALSFPQNYLNKRDVRTSLDRVWIG